MKAKLALPERVRLNEGLGRIVRSQERRDVLLPFPAIRRKPVSIFGHAIYQIKGGAAAGGPEGTSIGCDCFIAIERVSGTI